MEDFLEQKLFLGCEKDFNYLDSYQDTSHKKSEHFIELDLFYKDEDTIYLSVNLNLEVIYTSIYNSVKFVLEKIVVYKILILYSVKMGGGLKEICSEEYNTKLELYIDDIPWDLYYIK